jgi:NADPH:quinone reductase-like Zn-dependent oxidoreductase
MSTRLQLDAFGEPSVLYPVEFELAEPGEGEVAVHNTALGVNPFDWKYIAGLTTTKPLAGPVTPGNEGAGVVTAVGDGVTDFAVGDEVIWRTYLGGYASDRVIEATKVWHKPASIDFAEAAGLPVAGGTALATLTQAAVRPGDVVLVHGASGGVGGAAVQLAVALGATVIGTASAKNQDYVRSLGGIPVVYGEGLADRVRALGAVTVIVDCVGSPDAIAASRDLMPGLERAITITHAEGLTPVASDPTSIPRAIDFAAAGQLRLEVAQTFALTDAVAALTESKTGHVRGKIVLLP